MSNQTEIKAGDRIFSFNSGLHIVKKIDPVNRMYICELAAVRFEDCQLSATAEQIEEAQEGTQTLTYLAIKPEAITAEEYEDALETLPPCRWASYGEGVTAFHFMERITGDIVSWYAKSGDRYAEFYGLSTIDGSTIRAKFKEAQA